MRKTTALLDPIPAAVLALAVLAATAQPPAPQRTDASRFREPDPIAFDDHAGFVSIFDGQTLKNWVGDPAIWRVENGVMVGDPRVKSLPATAISLITGSWPRISI